MAVTQKYHPAFAIADVDGIALGFEGSLAANQYLTDCSVTVDGGFTVGTPLVGTLDEATSVFTEGQGPWAYVILTATAIGSWVVKFTVDTSDGRTLNRSERIDVVEKRS